MMYPYKQIYSTRTCSGGVASTHFKHTNRQGNHSERYADQFKIRLSTYITHV